MATDDEGSGDDFSVYDEWDDYWYLEGASAPPTFVVGYVFGPKKMSTMGVVMAEASKTKLASSSLRLRKYITMDTAHDPQLVKEEDEAKTMRDFDSEPSLTLDRLRESQLSSKNQVEIILDAGHDLRNVVRRLQSSCSSCADSASTSTGTRTASTVSHMTSSTPTTHLYSSSSMSKSNRCSSLTSPSQQIPIRVSFVPLDPEIPLEEQHGGRIDVILHKLTEDILVSSQWEQQQRQSEHQPAHLKGDEANLPLDSAQAAAIRRVQRLCDFSARHGCPLVDHPNDVQRLMNRAEIAETLQDCLQGVRSTSGRSVGAPKYAVLAKAQIDGQSARDVIQQAKLKLPLMIKPLTAAGTKASHSMAVLLRPDALEPNNLVSFPIPSLCQEYVNHDAWLYKVYVLGDFCSVHKRRSLPNLPTYDDSCHRSDGSIDGILMNNTKSMVAFDSQRPYPRLRDFGYPSSTATTTTTATNTSTPCGFADTNSASRCPVTAEEVRPIVQALKSAFSLELFGFDVICASDNNSLLVVDVNYFPSYKEVPKFAALLAKYLTDRALERRIAEATTVNLLRHQNQNSLHENDEEAGKKNHKATASATNTAAAAAKKTTKATEPPFF
jgi:inositol-1,3,4-trisphosphate 5/6-kinase/inositol-tetrakisphosphate 1-kinase